MKKEIKLVPSMITDVRGTRVELPTNGTLAYGSGVDKNFTVRNDSNGFIWMAVDGNGGYLYFNRMTDGQCGQTLDALAKEHFKCSNEPLSLLETKEDFAKWILE
jgi:hypothetical protein